MKRISLAARTLPIIVSEFGAGGTRLAPLFNQTPEEWLKSVLSTIDRLGMSFTAWDLHPAAGPTLISDWNYTPTSFGKLVKEALEKG
jgi:hypothetical protein